MIKQTNAGVGITVSLIICPRIKASGWAYTVLCYGWESFEPGTEIRKQVPGHKWIEKFSIKEFSLIYDVLA